MEERLQKILAKAGFGSRRSCEKLISSGRVRVNGRVAILGSKADITIDQITLDGKAIPKPEEYVYIALHKPRGVISAANSPDPRPTVRDLIPIEGTLYPVGRLDVDSEGLVLMTNDGELSYHLTHPKFGHSKEYQVLLARQPDDRQLKALRHGVVMADGYQTRPVQVQIESLYGKGAWIKMVLNEGRKRQIRETCLQIGLPVVRIIRVRIGPLKLGNLKPREWRYLTPDEIKMVKKPPVLKKKKNQS